ncbi:ABC transporter substrate-binding protein [Vibrio ouci]|uniref:ABC transporter substrate-binding protein n=1 Tax=Vibrio ouci TaxID=2499078 RepID=A0A4Y8WKK6_9VIBR|nr:ABC transporter substrate-binding protein [Vibrio ouci]TFH93226.1 ABC transporter substrate-binding protein [Vibrio ouci]
MSYWKSLAFCRDTLNTNDWTSISLNQFSEFIGCTRRNTQFLIKRLISDHHILWQPGVGRGNLPKAKLVTCIDPILIEKAQNLLKNGKIEQALDLVKPNQRDSFLSHYLSQYQATDSQQDILQIPFYRATHDLDPIGINRRTEQHIASYLYARLLHVDPVDGSLQGDLAHSWVIEHDRIHIKLRKGLKFHDGSPLQAKDVKEHFQRLSQSPTASKALFNFIDDIIIEDLLSLVFVSRSAPKLVPKLLAHGATGITKMEQGHIIGSGSFKLAEQSEWRTLLTVNPYYHGYRPWIDGIEIWNVGNNAKSLELNCDVVHASHLRAHTAPLFHSKQQWELGCVHAMLNPLRHSWMKKRQHRFWLQTLMQVMGEPSGAQCEVVAQSSGMLSTPQPIAKANLTQAETTLSELNKPSEPLQIVTYQLGTHIETAKLISAALSKVGVTNKLTILEYPVFNQLDTLRDFDIIVTGEVFGEDLPMSWLGWLLCTFSNLACLDAKSTQWLHNQCVKAIALSTEKAKLNAFQRIERDLKAKGLYQPLYHVQQDLSISESVSTPDLLANGWIDFNKVTMN